MFEVRCDQPSKAMNSSLERLRLCHYLEFPWRNLCLTQPMELFSGLLGFSCGTFVQPNGPDRHSESGFQSGQGEKVRVGFTRHRPRKCFTGHRTLAGSFVDRQVPFTQGTCENASNRARVLSRNRTNNSAGRPLTRHQVVHWSAHRLIPPSHAARLRRLDTSRHDACQVPGSRWVRFRLGITAVSFA